MTRDFDIYLGIDLGGARGKTTSVARLAADPAHGVAVEHVLVRSGRSGPWNDAALLDYVSSVGERAVLAINAPLTTPACMRCQLAVCPGTARCPDPAVAWLLSTGAEMVEAAQRDRERDRDRIAAVPAGRPERATTARAPTARLEPYLHRAPEVALHFQRQIAPRDALGQGTGPIAARGVHLRRRLATLGYELHANLLEVSARATVHALFGARSARGYKRDADPWLTRAAILDRLGVEFAPGSRLAREDVLRNDHCFDALICAYTACLWAREEWTMPEDAARAGDGWIWAPP